MERPSNLLKMGMWVRLVFPIPVDQQDIFYSQMEVMITYTCDTGCLLVLFPHHLWCLKSNYQHFMLFALCESQAFVLACSTGDGIAISICRLAWQNTVGAFLCHTYNSLLLSDLKVWPGRNGARRTFQSYIMPGLSERQVGFTDRENLPVISLLSSQAPFPIQNFYFFIKNLIPEISGNSKPISPIKTKRVHQLESWVHYDRMIHPHEIMIYIVGQINKNGITLLEGKYTKESSRAI